MQNVPTNRDLFSVLPYFTFEVEVYPHGVSFKSGDVHTLYQDEKVEIWNIDDVFEFETEFYLHIRKYPNGNIEKVQIVPLSFYDDIAKETDNDLNLIVPLAKLASDEDGVIVELLLFNQTIYLEKLSASRKGYFNGENIISFPHISLEGRRATPSFPLFIEKIDYHYLSEGKLIPVENTDLFDERETYRMTLEKDPILSYETNHSKIACGYFEGNSYITLGSSYPSHEGIFKSYDQTQENVDRYYVDIWGKSEAEIIQATETDSPTRIVNPGDVDGAVVFRGHYEFFE